MSNAAQPSTYDSTESGMRNSKALPAPGNDSTEIVPPCWLTVLCTLTSVCSSGVGQAGVNIAGSAIFAKFSRDDEREADAAGIDEMVRAGINPQGMPEMFQKLLNERQAQPGALDTWFATHPLEEERIDNSKAKVAQINAAILRTLTSNTQAFNDFRARVRSLPPPPVTRSAR